MSSLSTSLKNSYQRWLYPYEEYLRVAKPGVQHQLDTEHGGPFTPSPGRPSANNNGTPVNLGAASPAGRASVALNQALSNGDHSATDKSAPASVPPPESVHRPTPGGFTSVNGGFSAVNSPAPPSGFTAVNGAPVKQEVENGANPLNSEIPSAKNTPEPKSLTNGHTSNGLKRAASHESLSGADGDKDTEGGRRSKRLKKDGPPTVAGSHMSLLRPTTGRMKGGKANVARHYGDVSHRIVLLVDIVLTWP